MIHFLHVLCNVYKDLEHFFKRLENVSVFLQEMFLKIICNILEIEITQFLKIFYK